MIKRLVNLMLISILFILTTLALPFGLILAPIRYVVLGGFDYPFIGYLANKVKSVDPKFFN